MSDAGMDRLFGEMMPCSRVMSLSTVIISFIPFLFLPLGPLLFHVSAHSPLIAPQRPTLLGCKCFRDLSVAVMRLNMVGPAGRVRQAKGF
jgi:hypothetical protein